MNECMQEKEIRGLTMDRKAKWMLESIKWYNLYTTYMLAIIASHIPVKYDNEKNRDRF